MNWHQKDIGEIFRELGSSDSGLSEIEASERLRRHGPNRLQEKKKKTPLSMFLDQFKDFMILVLMAAAVISGIIGEASDTIAILVIVVLNAVIGFVQEYRAEKAMAALKQMAAQHATVVRDGDPRDVPAEDLVPGDVLVLDAGRIVPADVRLVGVAQLRIEEAALTGESVPVEKQAGSLQDETLPVGDRKNMAYKGTTVSYGRGRGIVVETGMDTELGKIAAMLQEAEEVKTPLQKRLGVFGKNLAIAVLAICAIVFGMGILRGSDPLLMLLTAISLAVAAIPEALPAVVTISLAIGAKKMVRQNVLIRKLPAVETLGSVTYICSDKTGTLTENRMRVEQIFTQGESLKESRTMGPEGGGPAGAVSGCLFTAFALNNDAVVNEGGGILGDPTETALLLSARKAGFAESELLREFPRISEVPFDSDRKMMTTIHEIKGLPPAFADVCGKADPAWRFISFTKGAVEVLIERSLNMLTADGAKDIDREVIRSNSDKMASDGLRVLGAGFRMWDSLPEEITSESIENGLTFLGFAGLMDPPRREAAEAVEVCKTAGITPVMITGDHPITAKAVARRIGIHDGDPGSIISGPRLAELPLTEFEERVEHLRVYARVAPEQKLKIIRALQDKGQFVAMTGDGVNDAPALKRADIGISMGITGTDVAKEASHMILLDDNFATIVGAVKEGRRIFDNIRKFIRYTMTSNAGEIWTIFLAPFFGLPIPLLPIHILWINLVTDGLPGLALAAEPPERDIMRRPPRDPGENIFTGMWMQIIWIGLLMGGITILTQAGALRAGIAHWQTMVFTVLCLSQMGNVLALRSERESLFSQGLFSNQPLFGAFLLTVCLQMATIYVPFLNPVFKTEPLSFVELCITLGVSTFVFFSVEAEKWWKRRRDG